jgi:hypothetical protein
VVVSKGEIAAGKIEQYDNGLLQERSRKGLAKEK